MAYLQIRHFVHRRAIQFDIDLLLDFALWRFKRTGVAGDTIRSDITGINNFLSFVDYKLIYEELEIIVWLNFIVVVIDYVHDMELLNDIIVVHWLIRWFDVLLNY